MKPIKHFTKLIFDLAVLIFIFPGVNQLAAQSCEIPILVQVPDQVYNVGDVVPEIVFSSSVPGAEIVWTRNNIPIGLGSAFTDGIGNVPSFTADNTNFSCTNNPITSSFTVYARNVISSTLVCASDPMHFTITVNSIQTPTPILNQVANLTYNVGDVVPEIVLSSNVPGAVIRWQRNNIPIGLLGSAFTDGLGNVSSFTATNNSCIPITCSFTVYARSEVSPTEYCASDPMFFTITVNPTPLVVDAIANQNYNPGDVVPAIVFSSNYPGSTFEWSRTSGAIGLGAVSDNGNIPSFTAANTTCNPITSTFSVTGHNGNCVSEPTQFTITINPVGPPTVDAGPNKIVYLGYPDSSCTKLQSSSSGGVGTRTLTWSNGSHAAFINVCPTTTTVYYLTVTDSRGCSSTNSVKVCVIDVRCGSGNKKITICHGTGSATNPSGTLCLSPADAKWHFTNHRGDQLGACGIVKVCSLTAARLENSWEESNPVAVVGLNSSVSISGNTNNIKTRSIPNTEVTEAAAQLEVLGYPNPSANNFTLNVKSNNTADKITMQVMDMLGRIIEIKTVAANSAIKIGDRYMPGTYFVRIIQGNEHKEIKLIKLSE